MTKMVLIAAAALVAGCASAPVPPSELTNLEVCEAFFYATEPYATQAGQEATNRGLRCTEYRDAIAQAQRAREAGALQATQDYLLRHQTPAPAAPVQCGSYRIGNSVSTTCR